MQLDFFNENSGEKPKKIGQTSIHYKKAGSILSPATGFMNTYDYTLNPYSGCAYGCTYCYAAFFARDNQSREQWGYWVNVKENALELLMKWRKKPLTNKTIYMSSVTDPYQPIEKKIELTRDILKELIKYHNVRLVVQTRSPIATRDIDLFKQFNHIQINMTVTTDDEGVRKTFEPLCPSNKVRLDAITEINRAGVASCITMTPLLPIENPHQFGESLLATGIKNFIIQPFHQDRGKFTAGTREDALHLFDKFKWTRERYLEVEQIIRSYIPDIGIGKDGFKPI